MNGVWIIPLVILLVRNLTKFLGNPRNTQKKSSNNKWFEIKSTREPSAPQNSRNRSETIQDRSLSRHPLFGKREAGKTRKKSAFETAKGKRSGVSTNTLEKTTEARPAPRLTADEKKKMIEERRREYLKKHTGERMDEGEKNHQDPIPVDREWINPWENEQENEMYPQNIVPAEAPEDWGTAMILREILNRPKGWDTFE